MGQYGRLSLSLSVCLSLSYPTEASNPFAKRELYFYKEKLWTVFLYIDSFLMAIYHCAKSPGKKPKDFAGHRFTKPEGLMLCESLILPNRDECQVDPHKGGDKPMFSMYLKSYTVCYMSQRNIRK